MKTVVLLACCLACVVSRPQAAAPPTPVPILMDNRVPINALGGYSFRIQTGDGVKRSERHGPTGFQGKMITSGQYSFRHPDNTLHILTYTADENGYHPKSDLLPTPYPLEPWQKEQVLFAERQMRLKELAASQAAGAQAGSE